MRLALVALAKSTNVATANQSNSNSVQSHLPSTPSNLATRALTRALKVNVAVSSITRNLRSEPDGKYSARAFYPETLQRPSR